MASILGGSGSPIVYVDDANPLIQYGSGWSATDNVGVFDGYGYPLYGTLHEASTTAGFSFTYSGRQHPKLLSESAQAHILDSYTGTQMIAFFIDDAGSDYTCVLDGVTLLDKRPPAFGDLNPIASCASFTDVEGQHELKVTVFGNQSNPVFLDYIAYIPSSNVTSADFAYFPGGQAITFGPADSNTFALFPHSSLDFVFYGYSVTLRGFFDNEAYSHTPSPASYTIDGGEPVNFTVTNSATNSTPLIQNQVLIQTPLYPLGQHTLHLVFSGTNNTSPLATADIIVQNQTSHVNLTPIPPSQSPSQPSSQPNNHRKSEHHIVILVGVVMASLVALVLFTTVVFILWRRRAKRRARVSLNLLAESPTTYDHQDVVWLNPSGSGPDIKNSAPVVLTPDTILVHIDSGVRPLSQPNGVHPNIIELPPRYETIIDRLEL